MSIKELRTEVDRLSPEERLELTTYLVTRDRLLNPDFIRELTRKIDDRQPEHWMPLEDAEKRLLS